MSDGHEASATSLGVSICLAYRLAMMVWGLWNVPFIEGLAYGYEELDKKGIGGLKS